MLNVVLKTTCCFINIFRGDFMNNTNKKKIKDPGSAITHFIGMMMAIFAGIPLLIKATKEPSGIYLFSAIIYIVSMILLYAASTMYHTFDISKKINQRLKKFDHIAIYYLIAGSYTPFLLTTLRGPTGWTIFGIIWGLALLGTVLKLITSGSGTKIWSILLYLGMGWLIVFASRALFTSLNRTGLTFLILGGIFYTTGVLFYVQKKRKYTHAVWHAFVLTGTIMHFFAVLFGCVLI